MAQKPVSKTTSFGKRHKISAKDEQTGAFNLGSSEPQENNKEICEDTVEIRYCRNLPCIA